MSIGYIVWPNDPKTACDLYLRFIIPIVERIRLSFPADLPDPIALAKGFVAGEVSESDYEAARLLWWDELDARSPIRNTKSTQALTARIALCLLTATRSEAHQLGEHLSWFLEVLYMMQIDTHGPIREMNAYFTFDIPSPR